MKREAILLLLSGSLCISFRFLTSPFITVPVDLADFLKGMGVSFMIAALIIEKAALK
jgi:hypothetical protein